jgi:hypothetical protein
MSPVQADRGDGRTIAGFGGVVKCFFFANDFNGLWGDVRVGCEVANRKCLTDNREDRELLIESLNI